MSNITINDKIRASAENNDGLLFQKGVSASGVNYSINITVGTSDNDEIPTLGKVNDLLVNALLPVPDTTSIAKGYADSTKQVRFDVTGVTPSNIRILTVPDKDITVADNADLHDAITLGTANGLSLSTQELNLTLADTTTTGALSSADWNTFDGKQDALGYTPEDVANKVNDFTVINDTLYPSTQAVQAQIAAETTGLWDDRGNYDASGNTFPASGGSGDAGAILKGDIWTVSVAGTLGGEEVNISDTVRALVDTPGQTATNWALAEGNLGYTPENITNKVTSISGASTDTEYGSAKLLYDQLALKAPLASPTFTGTVTIPTPFTLGAISVTVTGTELNYLSGVTSGVQGQLNTKQLASYSSYADSPMVVTGGEVSEGTNAGTLKTAALGALLRSTDSETGLLAYVTLAEQDNIAIPVVDTTYVVALNYNGGSPTISLVSSDPYDSDKRNIPLGKVRKDSSDNVHYLSCGYCLQDGVRKSHIRANTLRRFELSDGGAAIAYSGTDNFTMTSGVVFAGNNGFTLGSYDSAVTTFVPVYGDGGAGFTEDTPRNTIDFAHYDDGDGTPGNVGIAKYSTHWVYQHVSDGDVFVRLGMGSYSLAEAETEQEPLKPDHLTEFGTLIGKIIAPQAGGSFATVQMGWDTTFTGVGTSDHTLLGNLNTTNYTHLTSVKAAGVTLNKLDATVAPSVNEDSGDGYAVGSNWIDVTADIAYFCLDATVGAAVWQEVGAGGGGGGLTWEIITTNTNAVDGVGYFIDASAGTVTLTLLSTPSIDNKTAYFVLDSTNTVTIARNGSNLIGEASDLTPTTSSGQSKELVYSNATEGWADTNDNSDEVEGVSDTFVDGDLTAGVLTIAHSYGVWYPSAIAIYDNNDNLISPPADDITISNNSIAIDFSDSFGTLTGTWRYNFGNATSVGTTTNNYTNYGNYYSANSLPLDYDETLWSVSTRPVIDYDIIGAPLMRFDYASTEYAGTFVLDEIPAGSTNLAVRVKVRPFSTGATGTNMGWTIKYIVVRDNVATTSIATQILGSTAFETSGAGDTTDTYEIALSTLSAQSGDTIACILYPNTAVATPKQTDWMLLSVNMGVS